MNYICYVAVFVSVFGLATEAQAYIGPGAGLSAIGSVIAFVGAILLMIVGFLWYPIKKLIRMKKAKRTKTAEGRSLGEGVNGAGD
jgi:hypothetical protein